MTYEGPTARARRLLEQYGRTFPEPPPVAVPMSPPDPWAGKQTWVLEIDGSPVELYDTIDAARADNTEWELSCFAWEEIKEDGRCKGALMVKFPSSHGMWRDTGTRLYRHS